MKVEFKSEIKGKKADALITGVYEGLKEVEKEERERLKALSFGGKRGEVAVLPGEAFKRVIFVGLGKKSEVDSEAVRLAAAKGIRKARELKAKKVVCELLGVDKLKEKGAKATAEGLIIG
ncbi:MAG: M17 family peptidase N-terminal domain-containing protein, partial [Desulfurobacteriaceae bacterium]